jgi:predicted PurR-regulated permease PerM
MLLVVLGVFGGAIAFGFIGLFVGPALLAVGWNLIKVWLDVREEPA